MPPLSLDGKVSIITGSSRGIGAETAKKLALRGSKVILSFREKRRRAEDVAAEIRSLGGQVVLVQADRPN